MNQIKMLASKARYKILNPRFLAKRQFQPYIKPLTIGRVQGQFFHATPQAKLWYDPIKPEAQAEYEWLLSNVSLKGQKIVDGGAHHGQYSVVLALGANRDCELISVDPSPSNCAIVTVNLCLNGYEPDVRECAISTEDGTVYFTGDSNGKIVKSSDMAVTAQTLPTLAPDAQVVKLDIESAEFQVLPTVLDVMDKVHTWIIEVHPHLNRPAEPLTTLLRDKGFNLYWVNRESNSVEKYQPNSEWSNHTTIFALA